MSRRVVLALDERCLFFMAAIATITTACGSDGYDGPRAPVKVMTRNLYLGADLLPVISAPTLESLPDAVARFWAEVNASDFPNRAKLLAEEIRATAPDLVSLQEVELYLTQAPSDFNLGAPAAPNAALVAIDFLELLQNELAARGARYIVVQENSLSDTELPGRAADGGLFDVRMIDRDVILAREGVITSDPQGFTFTNFLPLILAGGKGPRVELKRGWSTVTASLGATTLTFANAHLELGGLGTYQQAQANELARALTEVVGPVVLAGDLNSPPAGGDTRSYDLLTRDLDDAYAQLNPNAPGYTCCLDLDAPGPLAMGSRIDLVLTRGNVAAIDALVTGTDPAARTASGLAASDHAGLVVTVGVPTE
jgi:endonuclease/exonuclease/phosphatase family metal-dependent hydrolase